MDLTDKEWRIARDEFRMCDSITVRRDIAFLFPSKEFCKSPRDVADRLQLAHDFLFAATPVSKPPRQFFYDSGRIILGYRHKTDEISGTECQAGWFGPQNRINIPWDRLTVAEHGSVVSSIGDQPEFTASHELVHPFEHIFLYGGNQNEKWKEGFCDCLRVLVLQQMRLPDLSRAWEKLIKDAAVTREWDKYHDAAGRIFNWIEARVGGRERMASGARESIRVSKLRSLP